MNHRWILLPALLAGAAACGRGPSPETTDALPPAGPAAPVPTGRVVVDYEIAPAALRPLRDRLRASRLLDTLAVGLNDTLAFPENIVLSAGECGEPNAFYRPELRRVTLCYELLDELDARFSTVEEGDLLVAGTVAFVLLHELGHALIHVLDLPATGREEDAVDQLATLLMLREGAIGDSLAFAVAGWFAEHAARTRLDRMAFADEHGLGQQRVYNILCWIHGRDPARYPRVLSEGWLTPARAERCPAEFRRLDASWSRLLAPHLRPGVRGAKFP